MKQQKVQRHFKVGKIYYNAEKPTIAQYIKIRDSVGNYAIIRMYGLLPPYYDVTPAIVDGYDFFFSKEETADQLLLTFITNKSYDIKFE